MAATPSSEGRLPGIDGLRAIAALSILVVHTWGEASRAGRADLGRFGNIHIVDLSYGVTLFFALSGFLLYRPFAAALLGGKKRPRFDRYLRNRVLRIFPAYLFVLLLCGFVVGGLSSRDGDQLVEGRLSDVGLLLRAAFLVQNYDPATLLTGIAPAWSLAVEVVFYLTLPLLAMLAFRLGRGALLRGRILAALAPPAVLLVVGLAGKAVTAYVFPTDKISQGWSTDWHSVLERSFFCQADLFSFGMALAVVYSLWIKGQLRLPRHWQFTAVALALLAYVAASRVSSMEAQLTYSPYNTLMALACALLLALVVLARPGGSHFVRILETRAFVIAGVMSYSIFLWHYPLVLALRDYGLTFDGLGGFVLNLMLVLTVTGILSALTYRYIEAPALKVKFARREDPRSQRKPPSSDVKAPPRVAEPPPVGSP